MRKGSILTRWAKAYLFCAGLMFMVLIGLTSELHSGADPATFRRNVEWLGVAFILLTGLIAWALWLPLARRLGRIRETVQAYARGDFNPRLPADGGTEVDELSADLNWMAHQLHLQDVVEKERRQEQEAVLASMMEGVMAIDADGCLISMNRAARAILNVGEQSIEGRLVSEIIRQDALIRFIRRALSEDEPLNTDLTLREDGERHLELMSSALTDGEGQRLGALIVMNEVTQMRRLEGMRRDFVANVSHELRTPITSIKGFMETLQDGAIDHPEEARRFLTIIARQADRLDAIIEDLLSLSRVEQDAERGEIQLNQGSICNVLRSAAQAAHPRAESRSLSVDVDCDEKLTARINAPLLEQAVINLIDNAVKYSDANSRVRVSAEAVDHSVFITVTDKGPGIPREHHERIFERFYRVDKSRSRQLGGTGLGLSIVKHIVQAHGGIVSVQSAPGKGSTFTIRLPG